MHRDSDDAKAQLAMEAQIVAKEKEVLRELEEAAAARAEEEGQEAEEVEDSSALRNQFNFSDRTYQTVVRARRDEEVMTIPPKSIEFSDNAVSNCQSSQYCVLIWGTLVAVWSGGQHSTVGSHSWSKAKEFAPAS